MKSKISLKFLAALSAILIVASIMLTRLVISESRDLIKKITLANTGYELIIAGNIDIQFFPSSRVTLNDVRLRNPSYPQELASTSVAELTIDVKSLLQGDLHIRELNTNGLHVNLYTGADGINIWANTHISSIWKSSENSLPFENRKPFIIEDIQISDASVDLQNVNQGLRYSIRKINFKSRNINNEEIPFSIDTDFNLVDGGMRDSLPMRLNSKISIDSDLENISIGEINFSITPMLVTGAITIDDYFGEPNYGGYLESKNVDIIGLMQNLGYMETTAEFTGEVNPAQNFNFTLDFSGNDTLLNLDELEATLGETRIQASGDIRYPTEFSPSNIRYDVITSSIDLSPFIFSEVISKEQENESFLDSSAIQIQSKINTDVPLPIDLIKAGNFLGSIAIESITANDLIIENVNLFTNIEDGVLDIELQPTSLYGGTAQGLMRIDTSRNDTQLLTQLSLDRLNITEFASAMSNINPITGRLNVEASYDAIGTTINELLGTLNGATSFTVSENSVDIGLIKQVFTEIAALSPRGDSIQQWPDVIQFGEVDGHIILENGITDNQALTLRMDNFAIGGSGGIDLNAGAFNYDLQFTILAPPETQTIPINQLFHNIAWPVTCNSQFTDEVSQYCAPDFTRVREIFSQLGRNELQQRVEDEINDQIPDILQEPARQILRNILN
ncbi:MAG: AsmA family protein [Gammaproteobacteria bacterium]|nr:AsmA family protein [Gammaproteobacteria bacterium]